MIKWYETKEGVYEGRVGDVILAHVWYDTPLFFKKYARWRSRTTFGAVGYRAFGTTHLSCGDAQKAMEVFIASVAEAVLKQ